VNPFSYILSNTAEVLKLTGQHIVLVAASTGIACVIGVPLGVLLTRRPKWSRWVLGAANVLQTIPSLALLGFLIPLPFIGGIGARTAIVALILYSLLPIIRNTHAGISGVDAGVREAGRGMGMTDWQLLTQVEFPLAAAVILTGIRVAAVISVGVATIAAAVGAGGLGMYIFRGVSMVDTRLILAGAVPAAILALAADFLLGALERALQGGARPGARLRYAAVLLAAAVGAALLLAPALSSGKERVRVGSKNFTEQAILGELLAQQIERQTDYEVERRMYLGGTLICHDALVAGEIDAYVEYTGTALTAILKRRTRANSAEVLEEVRTAYLPAFGIAVLEPLGFNNTFAILIRGAEARKLGLDTLSAAAPHARRWRAAFGNEFMEREDGYRGLASTYELSFASPPRVMDLGLTYRALADGQVDLIAGDATSGLIPALDLAVLADDRGYFPPYDAAPLVRAETLRRHTGLEQAVNGLAGTLSDETMRRLNYAVDVEHQDVAEVARRFLDSDQFRQKTKRPRISP
jgi:osmoprotectant transport system permease protein